MTTILDLNLASLVFITSEDYLLAIIMIIQCFYG